ncbi:MAG: ParB/RepB/Spo0J family partition protein [Clostridiales bacterium]|nr:ParB/RepB/Spo0J family partition protein [Clostridiales bacterium]
MALGKGLDALLGGYTPEENSVNTISIYLIDNNSEQPRREFDERKLSELAASIREHGIVQPIIVKKTGERYRIIAGERRFRAAKMAGLNEVPAIIRDMNEQEMGEIALIENLQRVDLNPMEEAAAIKKLMVEYDLTQEEIAKKLGKSRPAVANSVRLLALPDEIQGLLREGKLSSGHARIISSLRDEKMMLSLAREAAEKGCSVRETERLAAAMLEEADKEKPVRKKAQKLSSEMLDAQQRLTERFGTKVSFNGDEDKGKIVIEYFSKEELMNIYDMMMEN